MPGHMGTNQVTVRNLRIRAIDAEDNLLLVEGAVPGARDGYVLVSKAKVGGRTLRIRPSEPASAPAMVAAIAEAGLDGVAGASIDDDQVSVPILTDQQLTAVVALLGSRDFGIAHIDTHLPSLDEVFLAITGQKASAPEDEQGAVADDALDADTNMEVSV